MPKALRMRPSLRGLAALVIMLIRKWLQPSAFTQNVQRTQWIVSRQRVILHALGMITIHSPHDNAGRERWGCCAVAHRRGRRRISSLATKRVFWHSEARTSVIVSGRYAGW